MIGFLIFIHEGGHYVASKLSGVKVKEFAIGFGPKIYSKQGKETLFTLRAIPFGGFNDIEGESTRVDSKTAFCNASLGKRIFIIAAGGVVNIVFGILVYFIVSLFAAQLPFPIIEEFMEEGIAKESGLEVGDVIIKLDDKVVETKLDIDWFMADTKGEDVLVTVRKPSGEIKEYIVEQTPYKGSYILGITSGKMQDVDLKTKFAYSVDATGVFIYRTYISVKNIFTGNFNMEQLKGPIGITELVAEEQSFDNFISLLCVISISLGVTNLFPLPALDGGKLVLLVIEGIRRKPFKEETELAISSFGFIFLISLAILVTTNDLVRILRGVIE